MLRFLKTKKIRIIAVIALLVVVYAATGFMLGPRWVRAALLKEIPATIAATPSVGAIRINPFLLQATIDDFGLADASGKKILGFERLFVDFEFASLWHRAYSFGNIDLTAPFVVVSVAHDGSLNLLALKPKASAPTTPPPSDSATPLPALRIASLKITRGSLSYEDHSRPDEFAARLEPINIEVANFTTGTDGGRFTLSAVSKEGERFDWRGRLSLQPLASEGEFRVAGLKVHTLWEYLQDRLNFLVNSGQIDVEGKYHVGIAVEVNLDSVALTDLSIRARQADADWVNLPSLRVTGTTVDVANRRAHIDKMALEGLKLTAWRDADGALNLAQLAASPVIAPGAGAGAAGGSAAALHKGAPNLITTPTASVVPAWTYDLAELSLAGAQLSMEDRSVHPAAKLELAPLSLRVEGASQNFAKPVNIVLDTRVNDTGTLSVSGSLTPQPMAADLGIKVNALDLGAIRPYLARATSMTLVHGLLGVDVKVHYGLEPGAPGMRIAGGITVDQLHTVDDVLHDDFVNWDQLKINGLNFTESPDRLAIDEIVIRKPYARVVIEADESMNVKRVLSSPGAGVAAAPARLTQKTQAPVASNATATATAKPHVPIGVAKISVDGGEANFSDLSVTPNFSATIKHLAGSIVNLSSKADSLATLNLHGGLDKFTPVYITGTCNVLGPALHADMALSFRNISLPIFNPYSGKFAGYDIAEGKLSTELHYKVDGRKLDAQHHIVIEQLEFGDKTASKDAVSLPVRLAVSLLKDRSGVIDLNLPVTGSLDDPEFSLRPVIWKVFVNIVEKAVTAPFALLGSLFGGGPDLQFIDFQPGQTALDAAALQKTTSVAHALAERPNLKIEVPIAVVPELDRPALIEMLFGREVAGTQAYGDLEAPGQLDVLVRAYTRDFGAEPRYPSDVTGIKSKPELVAAKRDFLAKAIRAHLSVGETELQTLGQQRALALQRALLRDMQVAPERVFLVANNKATPQNGLVRLELSLR